MTKISVYTINTIENIKYLIVTSNYVIGLVSGIKFCQFNRTSHAYIKNTTLSYGIKSIVYVKIMNKFVYIDNINKVFLCD